MLMFAKGLFAAIGTCAFSGAFSIAVECTFFILSNFRSEKMKNLVVFLLCLMVICCSFTSCLKKESDQIRNENATNTKSTDAESTSESTVGKESSLGLEFRLHDSGRYTCIGLGTCTDTNIVINTYNGLPVEVIRYSAFENVTQIKSVVIGESVLRIESKAFKNCANLEKIDLSNSVAEIGESAFQDCSKLSQITISEQVLDIESTAFLNTHIYNNPSNWENHIFYIGNHLIYADTEKISGSYTIKNGTTVITNNAFRDCSGLTEITIPDSVLYIGNGAFSDCGDLSTIILGNGITFIGYRAFLNTHFKNVYISDIAKWCSIEFGGGDYCTPFIKAENIYVEGNKTTNFVIPDGVTSIRYFAFDDCWNMENVSIPNSVTDIGDYAFNECKNLRSITISSGVKTIGKLAFNNCKRVETIIISNSVVSIGKHAFYDCFDLTDVYFTGTEEEWNAIDGIEEIGLRDGVKIHYDYQS